MRGKGLGILITDRSIKFALLLSFKRMFLDCLLKTLTTDKFKDIVPYLHPMECVYLIISSLSLQTHDDMETSEWFTNDFGQAYNIFVYIVRWMNWKVDESVGDEFYYETYFHDYGKMERYLGIK